MEHFYQNIEGWFDYQEVYHFALDRVQDQAVFVEVGIWLGKSMAYLGTEILNSEKNVTVYGIDNFSGSPDEEAMWGEGPSVLLQKVREEGVEKLKAEFLKNIEPVSSVIKPIFKDSKDAVKMFDDESIDFCFIDNDHTYENCSREISMWLPKIKKGGIIGGHDMQITPVAQAVTEKFGGTFSANDKFVMDVFPEGNFFITQRSPGLNAISWYYIKK